MALDHRRLIGPGKKNQAKFFALDKITIRPSGSHFCSASCGECFNEHEQSYAPTYTKATIHSGRQVLKCP